MVKTNNQRIIKNTMIMYSRMAVTIILSFLYYRIVLKSFGIIAFGIYNVVSNIVLCFSSIRTALTTSIQRYFNIVLEQNEWRQLPNIFSASVKALFFIAICSVLLLEAIGIPTIRYILKSPVGRLKVLIPFDSLIVCAALMSLCYYINLLLYALDAERSRRKLPVHHSETAKYCTKNFFLFRAGIFVETLPTWWRFKVYSQTFADEVRKKSRKYRPVSMWNNSRREKWNNAAAFLRTIVNV